MEVSPGSQEPHSRLKMQLTLFLNAPRMQVGSSIPAELDASPLITTRLGMNRYSDEAQAVRGSASR